MLRLGFGVADGYNLEAWLRKHGASKASLTSPVAVGGHDLIFGYLHGNTSKPTCAAGVAVQVRNSEPAGGSRASVGP